MPRQLKNAVINQARSMLAEIPFNTVYSYADNLFDKEEMNIDDPRLDKEVDFLKTTRLANLSFEDTTNQTFFTMKNNLTSESIQVSNRESSRGEIRGEILRNILNKEKISHSNETIFDVITNALKHPDHSDALAIFKCNVVGHNATLHFNESMEEEHFVFFSRILLNMISEKIENEIIPSNINPKNIRDDENVRNMIWEGIYLEGIYDVTYQFDKDLEQIQNKSLELRQRGYTVEAVITEELLINLKTERSAFINGEQDSVEFSDRCQSLLQEAQENRLSNLRGFGKIINNLLNILLCFATFGIANLIAGKFYIITKESDSTVKIKELADTVSFFKSNQILERNIEQNEIQIDQPLR